MADASDQGSSSKHPEPLNGGGFRPMVNMSVQPPKQEDLQKSYASIVGNDADAKGWYGSMSMSSNN
jgi:erythrocyte band 7 integral membrane protein